MIKGIIFDLDGTLIDTLEDIGNSVNAVLEDYAFPTYEIVDYRKMVGRGFRSLIEKAMPDGLKSEQYDEALEKFTYYYDKYYMDTTKAYEGIKELLNNLQNQGIKVAINSNKRNDYAQKLAAYIFEGVDFTAVLGSRENVANKPDPTTALEIIDLMGFEKNEVLYVGDSETDIKTAKNAGLKVIAVSWGFSDLEKIEVLNPDFIVNKPAEILEIIK